MGEEVVIVGGGNSAGQAAVFLVASCARVHVLFRPGSGLSDTMSRYLIRRIEENPNITIHNHTEIVALHGKDQLAGVVWRHNQTALEESRDIRHVFLMTGSRAEHVVARWVRRAGCQGICGDRPRSVEEDLIAARWPLARPRIFWKRRCPACLPWATSEAGASSEWRQPSVKDQWRSRSFTRSCMSDRPDKVRRRWATVLTYEGEGFFVACRRRNISR